MNLSEVDGAQKEKLHLPFLWDKGGIEPMPQPRCLARGSPLPGAWWLAINLSMEGMGSVEHYDFCSFGCLQKWVNTQVPVIPKAFFKAFGEE